MKGANLKYSKIKFALNIQQFCKVRLLLFLIGDILLEGGLLLIHLKINLKIVFFHNFADR